MLSEQTLTAPLVGRDAGLQSQTLRVELGDCRVILPTLPAESVQCCVTSPPYYGLRDYGCAGQIGLEQTPEAFVAEMVSVFREVRRVLKDDGTLWLNLGDSYANDTKWGGATGGKHAAGCHGETSIGRGKKTTGLPGKSLMGIPWRVALALQADGWILRQDIIWHKLNPLPESVSDRCTKAHEYLFLLTKSPRYYYDAPAIWEPALRPEGSGNTRSYTVANERPGENANLGGSLHRIGPREMRNKRTVWSLPSAPFRDAHFATFPPALVLPCVLAGSRVGDMILDPFGGSGTTGMVAIENGRAATLIEMNPAYAQLINQRTDTTMGLPLAL